LTPRKTRRYRPAQDKDRHHQTGTFVFIAAVIMFSVLIVGFPLSVATIIYQLIKPTRRKP